MIEARLSSENQIDAVFLCLEASKQLSNDKAIYHWGNVGLKLAKLTRGEMSGKTFLLEINNWCEVGCS